MHARKIRYDEEFIAPRKDRTGTLVEAFAADPDAKFQSPARELQDRLQERIGEISAISEPASDGRLRASASLAIIGSASLLLWSAIIATGFVIF